MNALCEDEEILELLLFHTQVKEEVNVWKLEEWSSPSDESAALILNFQPPER